MKRILFAVTGTVLGLVGLLSFKSKSPIASSAALPSGSASTPTASSAAQTPGTSSTAKRKTPTKSTSSSAAATAKEYTGQAVQTPYGVVQVAVKATGRHIDSVRFVQLTAYDGRSQQINSYAAPTLIQETLSAQSAQIDGVSGATYTSDGYAQSLQSALDQAGI